ncbi:ABC transporter permease [Deferribacteraceae bacterium V6Fe1]|uniref:ABC transporter permease n=1 Tax=Deferrivibrio essentukiensis TaxID=2880922 RepID=UPI001F612F57|nr:ABC transporter permease [Deferrivibrio essentukiensis]UOD35240.1 ABC transporter permease [Deferribacteraceae bacterium V6Fe1]
MLSYILKRIFWAIPTMFGVSVLVFLMVHLAPGDPALIMLGEHASKESVEKLREEMGLNKPLYEQYIIFISKAVRGDFGNSIKSKQPVIDEFFERFPATIELTLVSMLIAVIIGILAGIISAVKRYSFFDYLSMFGALAGVSMPVFWLGLLLIYFFSVKLGILPVSGRLGFEYYIEPVTGLYLIDSLLANDYPAFFDALKHLILPGIALGTIPMAIIARMTRSSMLEVMREDYIRTARAKGCSSTRVIFIHALRNGLIPVVTVIGLMLGALLAGAILTETTFSWPGIGKWIVNAVYQRDFPVVQCATLIIAVIFIIVNLLVDLIYAIINPKIRLE